MPTLIVDTNSIAPTTLTSTGENDPVFVSSNSTLLDAALVAGGVDAHFIIHGQLFNDSVALLDFYSTTPGDVPVLYVGETGSLSNIYQVYQGNSLSLVNYGNITTTSSFGTVISVYADNSQNFFSLVNGGRITAGSGQAATGGSPATFEAAVASNIGGTITNSGVISSAERAIYLGSYNGSVGELTNTGEIHGDVLFGDGTDAFFNYGDMFGVTDLGRGSDLYYGVDGNAYDLIMGGQGNDTVIGGDNADIIDGGTEFDIIFGNGGIDELFGGTGNDTVLGGDGDDFVDGGTGSDSLGGGSGNDEMIGDGGNDTMTGFIGDDTLSGNDGSDQMMGGDGDDTLNGGKGNDVMYGGRGDDSLGGGENNDTLYGGTGDDFMLGWTGNDQLFGNAGQDDLRGQVGNDTLNGGWGDDTLTGGSDADTFAFVRHSDDDVITDFSDGVDMIDMSAFQLTSYAALSGAISAYNGGSLIDLDAIGGEGSIWVQNVATGSLTSADFIL